MSPRSLLLPLLAGLAFHASLAAPVRAQTEPAQAASEPGLELVAPPSPADEPEARPAPQRLDEVRLKSGTRYRGTIAEDVPGSHVILITLTHETKRFAAEVVEYAGPVVDAPPAARAPTAQSSWSGATSREGSPPPPVADSDAPETVRLTLRPPTGLSFYARPVGVTGRGYTLLCIGACTARLDAGRYRMALGNAARMPVPDRHSFELRQDADISGEFVSRRGRRITGVALMVGGVALGALAALLFAFDKNAYEANAVATGITGGLAFLIGLPLSLTRDRAFIYGQTSPSD